MKRSALACMFALLAGACVETGPTATRPLLVEPITPALDRYFSGLREPERLVIRDEREFAAIWTKAYGIIEPAPPIPEVDFKRNQVIVVAMGEQANGGYAIEVAGVAASGGRLAVDVMMTKPGPGCAVTGALTQPLDMVKVPAIDAVPEFRDRTSMTRCS